MCPEIRWQIYIWHPGTVFVPCIHNNPINLQVLVCVRSRLVECYWFSIVLLDSGLIQILTIVVCCRNRLGRSATSRYSRQIAKYLTYQILIWYSRNVRIKAFMISSDSNENDPFPVLENSIIWCVEWSEFSGVPTFAEQCPHIIKVKRLIFVFGR